MEEIKDLLEASIQHEEKLKELYLVFATRYPQDRLFWKQLAGEEKTHAEWLRKLKVLHAKGGANIHTTVKVQAVNLSIQHIIRTIEQCEKGELPYIQALSIALDLEKGIVDSKILTAFDFIDDRHKDIGTKLQKATAWHRDKISKLFHSVKGEAESTKSF